MRFTFQYGSTEGIQAGQDVAALLIRFTFQYGSTEGIVAKQLKRRNLYLHSNMVLLKVVYFAPKEMEVHEHLHSNMVLLKATIH